MIMIMVDSYIAPFLNRTQSAIHIITLASLFNHILSQYSSWQRITRALRHAVRHTTFSPTDRYPFILLGGERHIYINTLPKHATSVNARTGSWTVDLSISSPAPQPLHHWGYIHYYSMIVWKYAWFNLTLLII